MNILNQFETRGALRFATVLLALGLPVTAAALSGGSMTQDATAATDLTRCEHCARMHSADGRPCPHRDTQDFAAADDHRVTWSGFGEVDPAADLFESIAPKRHVPAHRIDGSYVGFAEEDPAATAGSPITAKFVVAERSALPVPVGFGETDPSSRNAVFDSITAEVLVVCPHMEPSFNGS